MFFKGEYLIRNKKIGREDNETQYLRQKVFSLSEKFTVKDQGEKDAYYVEGSFMNVPEIFSILLRRKG
jgi:uncharacterized protein YxjI